MADPWEQYKVKDAAPAKDEWAQYRIADAPPESPLDIARRKLILGMNSQRTQFERERDPANQPGAFSSAMNTIGGMMTGLRSPFSGVAGLVDPAIGVDIALSDQQRKASGRSTPYRIAAAAATPIADVSGMERNADIGNAWGIVGNAAASAAPAVVPSVVRGLRGPRGTAAPTPKPVAIEKIVQAVEADAKAQPAMRANLESVLDDIGRHAQESGQPIRNIGDLAKITRAAAEANPYRQTFIEPFKDVEVTAPGTFKGRVFDYNRTTIGDLDARLARIHDTLYPKFMKGGAGSNAAQAAIGAEGAADLANEAAAIRGSLAKEIGQRAGVDPEIVAKARGPWGKLNDLAERFELESNARIQDAAKRANTPMTVGDVITGAKKIPINPKNWRTNISDRMIQSVFENYQPAGSTPIQFNPPAQAGARQPLWAGVTGPTQPDPLFRLPSEAELGEAQANQRGNLNYRANVNARAREAALEKIKRNLSKHGPR